MRPLLPRLERTVMLVRRNDRALSPVAERVWRIVGETVGRSQQSSETQTGGCTARSPGVMSTRIN
jgi:hypothetical protein